MQRVSGVSTAVDAALIERVYRERFVQYWRAMAACLGNRDDARDAVQEGFARALAARHTYRGEGSVEGWVWRIALNAAVDARRHNREQPVEEVLLLELPASQTDAALRDAVRQLPERQRLLIFLRYLADLSYEDMARVCGISEGAVGASLSKARRTLSTLLQDERSPTSAPHEGGSRHG